MMEHDWNMTEHGGHLVDVVTTITGLHLDRASYRFASPTDLVTDVTLVHPYDSHHHLKADTLVDAEAKKNRSYKAAYHAQGRAFAPLACNSFGQLGPDLLRFLWLVADRHAQRKCSDYLHASALTVMADPVPVSGSVSNFKRCRARLFRLSVQEVTLAIYEAVTERVFGRTYALQAYPDYRTFFRAPPPSPPGPLSLSSSFPLSSSHPPPSDSFPPLPPCPLGPSLRSPSSSSPSFLAGV